MSVCMVGENSIEWILTAEVSMVLQWLWGFLSQLCTAHGKQAHDYSIGKGSFSRTISHWNSIGINVAVPDHSLSNPIGIILQSHDLIAVCNVQLGLET